MMSPMPSNEVISGIFGSISLTAWITVLVPQLHANYKSGSAEGLSMAFLFIWLLGDIANFIGALLTRLAPTAIGLAGYFCIADLILICQCFYYKTANCRPQSVSSTGVDVISSEETPLLSTTQLAQRPKMNPWVSNTLSLLAVGVLGCISWLAAFEMGFLDSTETDTQDPEQGSGKMLETVGITLGYGSAVCYLCARIPQIIKNYREKSCEGLAILFFLLSLTGNVTYFISLLAYSQETNYLLNAVPWFLGSLGTVGEDMVVFAQFRKYSGNKETSTLA
ncbi:hypothetical protein NCS57_01003200 [Fusarium keratoplasticum]|uniref:Uncharacterized protein n=1 Tax=Fusarium keratoplasticum TaxID=1328300 RepID=A0ACC0QNG9_9HYPO|nr:hypothetical protein NCS57_01003200 [Fusarium keratoplasticum]KAI8660266.1 hypothetical protein NCS57_01003200 [Fusarium keratoplasticum]